MKQLVNRPLVTLPIRLRTSHSWDVGASPVSEPVGSSPPENGDFAAPSRTCAVGCLIELVQTLVLTLVIFFAIQTFIAQPFEVNQRSMENTLAQGDYVLVDKVTPRWDPYQRGEIVVFHPPTDISAADPTPFVKRVIAVGGQTVEINDGLVYVDGVALDEPYLYAVDGVPEPTTTTAQPPRWIIPEGQLFLLGDHRMRSEDSRVIGPVDVDDVIGRAWLRYWPPDRFGMLSRGNQPAPLGLAVPTRPWRPGPTKGSVGRSWRGLPPLALRRDAASSVGTLPEDLAGDAVLPPVRCVSVSTT